MADMPGILMDYHLIFMLLTFMLFFGSIVLIWLMNTKQACIVAIFFLGFNQMFCIMTMIGFFSITYIAYDSTTGLNVVNNYTSMYMFYMVFFAMLWLNGLMLFISIYKYMRLVFHEQSEPGSR